MNSQLGTWESIPPPCPRIPETPNFTTYFPRRSPVEEGIYLPPQITRPAPHDFETPALQRAKRMHVSSMPTNKYGNNDPQDEDDSQVNEEWSSSMSNCQHQSWPSSHSGTATSGSTQTTSDPSLTSLGSLRSTSTEMHNIPNVIGDFS
ncbi:hypothetical protein CROQUDRAFT_650629 [Cronartium quercuum f. sp. fusiforme G11]|uniref:Uncharacterized protein n=1 Tax=Cronartium quercuum f. sp. fusiforme G11 TaxID=708437 RepID=A0A9P6NXK8_9BASI|nr:hypothetical protein CROQUDRAFT_650629 [Cronartium quercuum f. sp. fusiforme G11]